MANGAPLTESERRFARAIGALDDCIQRTESAQTAGGLLDWITGDAADDQTRTAKMYRRQLVERWAKTTTAAEQAQLARQAELDLANVRETLRGCQGSTSYAEELGKEARAATDKIEDKAANWTPIAIGVGAAVLVLLVLK